MAFSSPITATLQGLPGGAVGQTRATLKIMSRLVREGKKSLPVVLKARQLTQGLAQKDWLGEASRIHRFVRDNVRYVKDPRGVESVTAPVQMLQIMSGDCDDKSVLCAALLEAIGHPTRFVAVGSMPNHFSHVFPQTRIGNKWITLECTEPWEMGRSSKSIVSRMIQNN